MVAESKPPLSSEAHTSEWLRGPEVSSICRMTARRAAVPRSPMLFRTARACCAAEESGAGGSGGFSALVLAADTLLIAGPRKSQSACTCNRFAIRDQALSERVKRPED